MLAYLVPISSQGLYNVDAMSKVIHKHAHENHQFKSLVFHPITIAEYGYRGKRNVIKIGGMLIVTFLWGA